MAIYQEAKVKLTNKQLNKLKFATKNKTETILRLNKKNFEDERIAAWIISNNTVHNYIKKCLC